MADADNMNFEFFKNEKTYKSPEEVNGDARKRILRWESIEAMRTKLQANS
jgi:hypothetical protein